MSESKELIFCCPQCSGSILEEIQVAVTVASEIQTITDDGDVNYDEQTNSGGEVSHYQCKQCGWPVPTGPQIESLIEWLNANQPTPIQTPTPNP